MHSKVSGRSPPCTAHCPGRSPALLVVCKVTVTKRIHTNTIGKAKPSTTVGVDPNKLFEDSSYLPARGYGPIKVALNSASPGGQPTTVLLLLLVILN